jgi:hypothetical protein
VIQVESIRWSVHLIPKWNKASGSHLNVPGSVGYTVDNVMDMHSKFFLNSFLTIDMFQFNDGDYELVGEDTE